MGLRPIYSLPCLTGQTLRQTTKNPIAGLRSYQTSVAGADWTQIGQIHRLAGARVYGNQQGFCNDTMSARSLQNRLIFMPLRMGLLPREFDGYPTGLTMRVCSAVPTLPAVSNKSACEIPIGTPLPAAPLLVVLGAS
jgi:hypothetical protein